MTILNHICIVALIVGSIITDSSPLYEYIPIASYEEIRDLPNHPEILLVDVRLPSKIKETGSIPTSINVPMADLRIAFGGTRTPEEFRNAYGRTKPALNSPIITTCTNGRLALTGAQTLRNLGYTNVKYYRGSWLEWAAKNNLPE